MDVNRKRRLDSAFASEAKRTKNVTETHIKNKKPHTQQDEIFTFLPFHLFILKSLYSESVKDKEPLWYDISRFLSHRRSLVSKKVKSAHLSELIQQVKKISEEASSTKYKTTVMNINEPNKNSNTVLSYITQSQLAQTFALTSPFKSEIQEKIFSPYLYSFQQPTKDQQQKESNTSTRYFGGYRRQSPKVPSSTGSTIQSMNLIMAALGKEHSTSVKESEVTSDPFLHLFHRVKDELDKVNLEWEEWKSKEDDMKKSMFTEKITSSGTISIHNVLNLAEQIEVDEDRDVTDVKAILLCKRGLWKALSYSLESALFGKEGHVSRQNE